MQNLRVNLPHHSYPVRVGRDLSYAADLLKPLCREKQVMIVADNDLPPAYGEQLCACLEPIARKVATFSLRTGEKHKELASVASIIDALIDHKYDRDAIILALGGGITGDIVGFCAAIYLRGIRYVQVPTTLLAMVDSSVGGKTGVNHPKAKNMIGAIYQPDAVIADLALLDSLPEREYKAGLAEVIKYGLIRDREFFLWLVANADKLLDREEEALTHAVAASIRHKAAIVEKDEKEKGERALLNLGHTFGHAFEILSEHRLLHGEAVAIGMRFAALVSMRMGLLSQSDYDSIVDALILFGLPIHFADYDTDRAVAIMQNDKKASADTIHFILLRGIGDAFKTSEVPKDLLLACLEEGKTPPSRPA